MKNSLIKTIPYIFNPCYTLFMGKKSYCYEVNFLRLRIKKIKLNRQNNFDVYAGKVSYFDTFSSAKSALLYRLRELINDNRREVRDYTEQLNSIKRELSDYEKSLQKVSKLTIKNYSNEL